MFSSVPILYLEDDDLQLAKDLRILVKACLKSDPANRPSVRIALNCAFIKLRDLHGKNVIYREV